MKAFEAFHFSTLISELEEYRSDCNRYAISHSTLDDKRVELYIGFLQRFQAMFRNLKLYSVVMKAGLIEDRFTESKGTARLTHATAAIDFMNLLEVLAEHIRKFNFVSVDRELVNNEFLLGQEVAAVFKDAVPDIVEAGNCISIDSGTAAVFHLMRVVEHGLRALCGHLGIQRVRKSQKQNSKKYVALPWAQWEILLNSAETKAGQKIDKLGPGKRKQDLQEFYIPLFQEIRGFKDAFRNHVMHSRAQYDDADAKAVLSHVKRFMSHLAIRLSE